MGLRPIIRYIGLASKVYCLQLACCHEYGNNCGCKTGSIINPVSNQYIEKIVCKGSSKFSLANTTFHDYLSSLDMQRQKLVQDYRIISKSQKIATKYVQKRAFSGFDDKRYLLNCKIHSYPYAEENDDVCNAPECADK